MTITGKQLEHRVAQTYRDLGARKVEHDVELGGHQIDVYIELETQDHGIHRMAIEAKEHDTPVGIKIVGDFSDIVDRLRRGQLIDEGIIVSITGFSRPARNAADKHRLRLLEPEDLEAIVTDKLRSFFLANRALQPTDQDTSEFRGLLQNQAKLVARFEELHLALIRALAEYNLSQALAIGSNYTKVAGAIAFKSATEMQAALPSSSHLSLDLLLDLQRSLFPTGYALTGFRRSQVWLGPLVSTPSTATFAPPSAGEAITLLQELLTSWNTQFPKYIGASDEEKIEAVAEFQIGFWNIHPFQDGNHEVSRLILAMQLSDLFGKKIDLTKSMTEYESAFIPAVARGDQCPLKDVIRSLASAT